MCGRYTLIINDLGEVESRFIVNRRAALEWQPRYNIAPTQTLPVVTANPDGGNALLPMRWGLIPFWSKDPSIGSRLINARAESMADKPSFREPLKRRRCLVPADGYYEWQSGGPGRKIPYRVVTEDGGLFAMAGLWDIWHDQDGRPHHSFSIVTTEPVDPVRHIHNRMPLILPKAVEEEWVHADPGTSLDALKAFVAKIKPITNLRAYRVSTTVNSPGNDLEVCVREAAAEV
ncbi:MAG: SOS response-associated peptidase [Solirubrobacterales bacterium]